MAGIPRLKRWYALIASDEDVQKVTLYRSPEGFTDFAVPLVEVPHLREWLGGIHRMISRQALRINWVETKNIRLLDDLDKANARIKELETWINNAGEE